MRKAFVVLALAAVMAGGAVVAGCASAAKGPCPNCPMASCPQCEDGKPCAECAAKMEKCRMCPECKPGQPCAKCKDT